MNKITLRKVGMYYHPKINSDSEILLRHINSGQREVWGDKLTIAPIKKIAKAHGWQIEFLQE